MVADAEGTKDRVHGKVQEIGGKLTGDDSKEGELQPNVMASFCATAIQQLMQILGDVELFICATAELAKQ